MTQSTVAASSPPRACVHDRSETGTRALVSIGLVLFCSMIPVTLLVAPLKEIIRDRYTTGSFVTHLFMSINMAGAILVTPIVMLLLPRDVARKKWAIIALCFDAGLLTAMSFAPTIRWILALRFFEGAAHVIAISNFMALAASWAPASQRGRAMGITGAAMMFGTACGTRLGGPISTYFPNRVFQIAGAISLATAALAVWLVLDHREKPESSLPVTSPARLLRSNTVLILPYVYAFMDRLCVGVVVSTLVLYLGDVLQLAPDQRSRTLLMFLLPFALLVYPAGRLIDRFGRIWPLTLASLTFGVVFAAYGFCDAAAMRWAMLTSGVVSALMFAPSLALTADLSPPEKRNVAFAGFNVAGSLGFLLGPIVGGALLAGSAGGSSVHAFRVVFIVIGGLHAMCAIATLPLLLHLRRRGLSK